MIGMNQTRVRMRKKDTNKEKDNKSKTREKRITNYGLKKRKLRIEEKIIK